MNNEPKNPSAGDAFNTPDADKSYLPQYIIERMELGDKGKLWSIEIVYQIGANRHRFWKRNQSRDETMRWRESIFRFGITHPIGPREWKIVPPMDIVDFLCVQQEKYLPEQ